MKKIVFYSVVLNHHQACVADAFYRLLGDDYAFVETTNCRDNKGGIEDYSQRPYLIKSWESKESFDMAMRLATTAEACVFAGNECLSFEISRLKKGLLSFDMGERMLKRGVLNLLSPHVLKKLFVHHIYRWEYKDLYKLCCSSFARVDLEYLGIYKDKCYKWGYFTQVDESFDVEASILDASTSEIIPLMWCSRFLTLKHPELPVQMAAKLKAKGYKFRIDMYGDEGNAAKHDAVYPCKKLKELIAELGVEDCVHLMGNRPNGEILDAMRKSSIFLFTSDRHEGWGAVANESLSNGCILVASDAIGSTPYLIKDGYNGFYFKSCDVKSLAEKVEWLINHPIEMNCMKQNAYDRMRKMWSPNHAAKSLLQLINDLQNHRQTTIVEGPCSRA